MEQIVYVDLFFMINFSMDFLCLFLTAQLLSSKFSLLLSLLSAALGGIYACLALFVGAEGISGIFIDIIVCLLLCLVAFCKSGHIVGHTVVYFAVSAVLGGFMTAMFELLNRADLPLDEIQGDGISAWVLLALAVLGGIATLLGGKFFKRRAERQHTSVHIELDGKKATLKALCDSGNMLCEPISGKACIIADIDALDGILPVCMKDAVKNKSMEVYLENSNLARRIRLIPTHTATSDGILIAIRCDFLGVGDGKNMHGVEALLALSVIGDSADGAEALVPASLMML